MKILDVIDYWFDPKNKDKWFNSKKKDDEEITFLFTPYLKLNLEENLSPKEELGFIILYDQMVRHFQRVKPVVGEYQEKALSLAMKLLPKDFLFNPEEKCFLLLPLRHTFEIQFLEIVISKMKGYMEKEDSSIYLRFWRATLLSYHQIKIDKIQVEKMNRNIFDGEIFEILDQGEETRAIPNLSKIYEINTRDPVYKSFAEVLKKEDKIIISLSGGVDSMVCSFILHHLKKNRGLKDLVAVMIDYQNRETCELEVELAKRWCKFLDISLYVLPISHLKRRRNKDRSLYEEVTRKIRFMMYKKFENYQVILGHNLDDCEENMITNIRKSKCYDNLRGMKARGEENGVRILRPMIDFRKKEIYKFAEKHGIPHLYDSTPIWCDRGKMRGELIPFLNNFDPAFLPGLLKLSESLKDIYQIYEDGILEKFVKEKIEIKEKEIWLFPNQKELEYGYIFWKDVVYRIIQTKKIIFPTNKSIRFMTERFKNRRYGKISLNKEIDILFEQERIRIIL